MTSVRVAAIQTGPAHDDRTGNLAHVATLVRGLDPAPDLVVLPELFAHPFWCVGLHDPAYFAWAEGLDGPTVTAMAALASSVGCHIVAPLFERGEREGEFYNSAALLAPDGTLVPGTLPGGQRVMAYRKNAISAYTWDGHHNDEKFYFRPGDGYPVFTTSLGRIGLLICYDRWYPEAWRVLALQGAELVLVPNASEGYVHDMFVPLMRTSAAQNVLFAVGVNRAGTERIGTTETRYYGRTCIVGPRGAVLAESGSAEPDAIVTATLDLEEVSRDRQRLWVYRDRRPELYGLIAAADGEVADG
jgi:predicted amidohydrolase